MEDKFREQKLAATRRQNYCFQRAWKWVRENKPDIADDIRDESARKYPHVYTKRQA